MKIYLDNCTLQRPLDDQDQPRIEQEAEAVIEILTHCEAGHLTLFSSESLDFEIGEIRDARRFAACTGILSVAKGYVTTNETIARRAEEFGASGIKAFDALHLASAEAGEVDFFCTCDDRLLKKAKALTDLKVKVVSPMELVEEVKK